MDEQQPGPEPTSLEALYAAVPAAEEEDLFEQAARDDQAALTALVLNEIAALHGEPGADDVAARIRRQEDPADWALPVLLRPDPGTEWRSALALARDLAGPEVVGGADGRPELRVHVPSAAQLRRAWQAVVVGTEPEWTTVWAEAAGRLGLPAAPLHSLLARLVSVLLDADLPAPIVADALARCLDEAGGRAG